MESRKDLVSVKEEPHDIWEDVANDSVDPEVSVKTENSDESSTNESSPNPTNDCISSHQKTDEDIFIDLESELVKTEYKSSLTIICEATVKEENPRTDANGKKPTILNNEGFDCEKNHQFTIGEESNLTRQIETTNEDDGSHELEIFKAENPAEESSTNESSANYTNDSCVDPEISVKTENSDESFTKESSANPNNDCISSHQKTDEDIFIDLESELVKTEYKSSLTIICEATVKEENPRTDANGKKPTIFNNEGFDCEKNHQFTIGEESNLTRQIETTNEDDGSHELEIFKAENPAEESSTNESSANYTNDSCVDPEVSVKTENSEESSTNESSENSTNDSCVDPEVSVKAENPEESSTNESSANPTNDCISSHQKTDDDIFIDLESELVKTEHKPSLATICQATVKEENPANDLNGKRLTILIKKGFDYDSNRQFTREEATSSMKTTHKGTGPLECEICHKSFRYPSKLKRHVYHVHDKNNPYQCKMCPESFGGKGKLKAHLNLVHHLSKPFECEICHNSFGKQSDLKRHISAVHDRIKLFECEICHNSFRYLSSLKRHVNHVHEKNNPYQCDICHKSFGRKSIVESHIHAVHMGSKPFECEVCHKSFGNRSNFNRHIHLVHKQSKPFECTICHKSFGQKSHLKRHEKEVHLRSRPFECETCHESFSRKYDLEKHINALHKKSKP